MWGIMRSLSIVFVFLELVKTHEVPTPSSLLGPRDFNHHAFEAKQYLKMLSDPVPTRKGPVLFPNDVPPPPPTPLIVTSRPLLESIARSDLNKNLTSNTISDQSRIDTVTFKPSYFARITQYKPMLFSSPAEQDAGEDGAGYTSSPTIGPNVIDRHYSYAPYTDIVKKSVTNNLDVDDIYSDYDRKSVLPPIYNALSRHAEQKLLKSQQSYPAYQYQPKNRIHQYNNNNPSDDGSNSVNAQDNSYAFSYSVKDQKTGDDFSHSQRSSGTATNGEYRVRLPDGRMQIVSYTADENGYKADVKYDSDNTGNSVERNVENSKQNENNYNYNNNPIKLNNAPQYNVGNNKFYSDYSTPSKAELYPDVSKEYYNDYSLEYGSQNDPHRSKFAGLYQGKKSDALYNYDLNTNFNRDYVTSTSKPNYLELRDVLTKALPNVQPTFNSYPELHETADSVVIIGGQKGFNSPNVPSVNDFNSFVASTPSSYLVSTIASLRDRVPSKPVLSDSFIKRINKYLSFK